MKLDENISSCQSLKCAVPQGSILGPIVFLIYVDDICNCSTLNILSFADDTTVTVSSSNINDMFLTMNSHRPYKLMLLIIYFYSIMITGVNQTWEIGRVSMKTRRYVGNREEKNHFGIRKTADFNMFR